MTAFFSKTACGILWKVWMPGTGKSPIISVNANIFSFQYLIFTAILFYLCFFLLAQNPTI
jgi:hypothetical protein